MTKPKPRKRDPKRRIGHPFITGWFKDDMTGRLLPQKGPAVPVQWPEAAIELDLIAEDVMQAHRKGGEGDSRFCAVAFLIRRQSERFLPYAVNGVVEFLDSRAYVGIGKPGLYPVRALRFEHSHSWLTTMFDKFYYKALIKRIEEAGGVISIGLRPYRLRLTETSVGKKQSPSDGTRSVQHTMESRRSMRLNDQSIGQMRRAEAQAKEP